MRLFRRHLPWLVVLCHVLLAGAAGAQSGTQTTPDGKQILISKDVGEERWSISVNLNDGSVTGNVFFRDGRDPQFVWCSRENGEGTLDPVDGAIQYFCRGADVCTSAPCAPGGWTDLGPVSLPGSFLLPAADPFSPLRTPEHFCDDECHFPEFLSVGEFSYTIDSGFCNYLTMVQTTREPIRAGDTIFIRLWHFALSAPNGGTAYTGVQIGDRVIWDARLPIPCRGGIIGFVQGADCLDNPLGADADPAEFVADFDAPAGTPIYFHVQNHGNNSYNFVEASVNGSSLIVHDDWQQVSKGLPLLPPSGIVPPRTPDVCTPANP